MITTFSEFVAEATTVEDREKAYQAKKNRALAHKFHGITPTDYEVKHKRSKFDVEHTRDGDEGYGIARHMYHIIHKPTGKKVGEIEHDESSRHGFEKEASTVLHNSDTFALGGMKKNKMPSGKWNDTVHDDRKTASEKELTGKLHDHIANIQKIKIKPAQHNCPHCGQTMKK
jgi:hypothetical protein